MPSIEAKRVFVGFRNHDEGYKIVGVRGTLNAARHACHEDFNAGRAKELGLTWVSVFDGDEESWMADAAEGTYEVFASTYIEE